MRLTKLTAINILSNAGHQLCKPLSKQAGIDRPKDLPRKLIARIIALSHCFIGQYLSSGITAASIHLFRKRMLYF